MPSGCQRPLPRAALGSHIFPPFLAHLDLAAPGSKESCMNRAKPTETPARRGPESLFQRRRNARLPRPPPDAPRATPRNGRTNLEAAMGRIPSATGTGKSKASPRTSDRAEGRRPPPMPRTRTWPDALATAVSLRRARQHVLAEFRHHLVGEKAHGLALPRRVRSAPIEAGHEQGPERANLLAERDQLVEHRFG